MKTARNRKRDRGQALVLTTLAMMSMMGFVGFATDIGLLLRDKVNLQKVADAAAISGAAQLPGGGDYTAAAKAAATQNGVTDGSNGTVTVTLGTTYHPSAVKVYVSQPERTFFMGMFGYSSVTVGATAVGGMTNGSGCLYALDLTPFKSEGITMNGTGNISASNCSIYDNSGLLTHGASGAITAKSISVTGSYSGGDATPTPVTGTLPVPDPLAFWTKPTVSGAAGGCVKDPKAKSGTVQPGCYLGLTVTGPATLAAGLYIVQGQLSLSGVTASGVTFYIDGANGGSFGGMDGSTLSAPTTGTPGTCTSARGCNGMLIWDTEVNSPDKPQQGISFGPSSANLYGVLYFPNASLKFHGDNTTNLNTDIVASAYEFDGTVNINNYIPSGGQQPVMPTPSLVE